MTPSLPEFLYRRAAAVAWLVLAAVSAAPTYGQIQSTAGRPGVRADGQLAPGTLSRLLLIAATRAGARVVAVGEHGYAIYSDDQGKTWRSGATSRHAMLTAVTFVDAKNGWAVGHDGQILATQDGGATWAEQRYKPDDRQPLFAVRFRDRDHGIAVGAYGLFLETADGGKTWTPRAVIEGDRHFYAVESDGSGRLAIAGEGGLLLTSTDQGRTWVRATSPYKGTFFGLVATADGALLAYGLRGNIFRSTDFGKTWSASVFEGTATLQGGARLASGEIVLVGGAGAVLSSRDNASTFQRVPGYPAMTYSAVLPTATGALLFGDGGVVPYVPAPPPASPVPDAANKAPQ